MVESSETFTITIIPTSLPSGVTLGSFNETTVTITDGMYIGTLLHCINNLSKLIIVSSVNKATLDHD